MKIKGFEIGFISIENQWLIENIKRNKDKIYILPLIIRMNILYYFISKLINRNFNDAERSIFEYLLMIISVSINDW